MFEKLKRKIPTNEEYIRQQKYKSISKEDLIHEVGRQRSSFSIAILMLFIALFAIVFMTAIETSNWSEDTAKKLVARTELLSKRLCSEIGGEYVFYALQPKGDIFVTCDNTNYTSTLIIRNE